MALTIDKELTIKSLDEYKILELIIPEVNEIKTITENSEYQIYYLIHTMYFCNRYKLNHYKYNNYIVPYFLEVFIY